MTLAEIRDKKLNAVIHTYTKWAAKTLVEILGVTEGDLYDEINFIECWDGHKENTCYRIRDGKVDEMNCVKFYQKINEEICKFLDLFATGGTASIHDVPMSERHALGLVCNIAERLEQELKKSMNISFVNGSSIETLPKETDVVRSKRALSIKEEKKMPTKFTFYTIEGYRIDKSNNTKIPTVTTEVVYKDKDGCATGGSATCDKADYSERDGILNAIANAVLGGNFDREYEKFLADKKRKYDESCKCKICGRNYYEDEKTGKRTPFTPEDARKHEEWHEQNKKNKREKYLIRKEAKRRLAEAEREGKIEQVMKEMR